MKQKIKPGMPWKTMAEQKAKEEIPPIMQGLKGIEFSQEDIARQEKIGKEIESNQKRLNMAIGAWNRIIKNKSLTVKKLRHEAESFNWLFSKPFDPKLHARIIPAEVHLLDDKGNAITVKATLYQTIENGGSFIIIEEPHKKGWLRRLLGI